MPSLARTNSHLRPPADADAVPESGRRLDVQGLRAVAVLLVVAFHSGLPVPGGFVGVDVFFVISGFVITAMLQREWVAAGRLNFTRFYTRRFKRLAPAFALVAAMTIIVSVFLLSPYGTQRVTATTAIGGVLLIANMMIARTTGGYFDAPAETNPLVNIWSLSVEEQFYLIFPTLIALSWWLGTGNQRHRLTAVVCVGAVVFLKREDERDFMMRCRDDYTAMIDWLVNSPPGLVIIGAISGYSSNEDYRVWDSETSKNAEPKLSARMLNEGLERTVEQLHKAGHEVLLLQTIPQYIVPPYTAAAAQCTGWKAIRDSCPRYFEMPLQFADNFQKASRDGIADVAAKTKSAVLDFRDYFCAEGTCSTRINGKDMYMPDGLHLNTTGSNELTETFIDAMKSLKPAVSITTTSDPPPQAATPEPRGN